MPDGGGMSGLDLSEIGAAAKKAGQQIAKAANPFAQSAVSQLTGKAPPPVPPSEAIQKSKVSGGATAPNEAPTGGTFDITALANSLKQQITGAKPSQQIQQQGKMQPGFSKSANSSSMPKASNINSANSLDNAAVFFDQKGSFAPEKNSAQVSGGAAVKEQQKEEERMKSQEETKQQLESLRKKLHDIQTEKILKAGEKKENQEEEEKKKKQEEENEENRKEDEKEERMQSMETTGKKKKGFGFKKIKTSMSNILTSMLKRRKGSHEGTGGKG